MKRTISVVLENRFGAFNRISTLFSGKGFNLHSITIGETEVPGISRMTLVTTGEDKVFDQIVKQLNRLIDTIKVVDLSKEHAVARELALITVHYKKGNRSEITELCRLFEGKVVDINNKTLMFEITGPSDKIDAAINSLAPYGIKEMARSGAIALKRGEQERQLATKQLINHS
ncbi:MAG: acetolactate synthase small subunit [Ignavibacteriales bacterium]|nr:acetolactate synthase small subunit [Ignavibacteriales bacterium]